MVTACRGVRCTDTVRAESAGVHCQQSAAAARGYLDQLSSPVSTEIDPGAEELTSLHNSPSHAAASKRWRRKAGRW